MNSLLAVQWTGLSCYVHGKSTDKICHLLKIFAKNYMRSLWPKNWRTKISSSSNLQFPIATLTFLSFQLLVYTFFGSWQHLLQCECPFLLYWLFLITQYYYHLLTGYLIVKCDKWFGSDRKKYASLNLRWFWNSEAGTYLVSTTSF